MFCCYLKKYRAVKAIFFKIQTFSHGNNYFNDFSSFFTFHAREETSSFINGSQSLLKNFFHVTEYWCFLNWKLALLSEENTSNIKISTSRFSQYPCLLLSSLKTSLNIYIYLRKNHDCILWRSLGCAITVILPASIGVYNIYLWPLKLNYLHKIFYPPTKIHIQYICLNK